jgi:hypothetical protein
MLELAVLRFEPAGLIEDWHLTGATSSAAAPAGDAGDLVERRELHPELFCCGWRCWRQRRCRSSYPACRRRRRARSSDLRVIAPGYIGLMQVKSGILRWWAAIVYAAPLGKSS